jgi:hypothetical protein
VTVVTHREKRALSEAGCPERMGLHCELEPGNLICRCDRMTGVESDAVVLAG